MCVCVCARARVCVCVYACLTLIFVYTTVLEDVNDNDSTPTKGVYLAMQWNLDTCDLPFVSQC